MKILVLVISSGTEPVYAELKEIWRSYMKNTPEIDAYFLEMGNSFELCGDTLYCPGEESLRGIIFKTIAALKYFPVWRYDYVLRTNLSSLWNFPRFCKYIEDFPRQRLYAGIIGHYHAIDYISGAGILMSPDVCSLVLIHSKRVCEISIIDDVDIGAVLTELGIPLRQTARIDILSPPSNTYDTSGFHYRIKMVYGDSRMCEPEIMRQLLKEW